MRQGFFEIGGEVEPGLLARGLGDALRHLRMTTAIAVGLEAIEEDAIRIALDTASGQRRAYGFTIGGLHDARPFDALRPVFLACHDAGARCRVIVDGSQGRQAAYARPGSAMLWIAFLLTPAGEVRYGPNSTFQPIKGGSAPGVSDWLDAAQALSEGIPPLTLRGR